MSKQDITSGKALLATCRTIADSIEDKVHGSSKLVRATEIRELQSFMDSISSHLETDLKSRPKFNPIKRELKRITKTLSSLVDGLEDRAIAAGEYRSLLDDNLIGKMAIVTTSTVDLVEKLEKDVAPEEFVKEEKISTSNGMSSKEVLSKLRDALKEASNEDQEVHNSISAQLTDKQREELEDEEAKGVLSKYSRFRAKMPRRVELFTVAELPVVPLFKDFNLMSDRVLTKSNIKHTRIGQHLTVFDNSIVLAFNRRTITKGKNTPKSSNAQKRLNSEYDKFVYEIVDTINDRSSVKYSVVSKKYLVSPADKNIMFVWLMPAQQLARLRQSANDSKGIELESWGFPWTV